MNPIPKLQILRILSFIIFTAFWVVGCKTEAIMCPERENIGIVRITDQTKSYVPENYSSMSDSIVFISQTGNEKKFYLLNLNQFEFGPLSTNIACEMDTSQMIQATYQYDEIYSLLYSIDSFKLILIQKVGYTPNGYYDLLNIWLSDDSDPDLNVLGQINIITDLREVSSETEIYNPVYYRFYDSITISGREFQNVYGDKSPETRMSDVYWTRYIGLVGFKEKNGMEWVLKEN